MSTSKIDRYDSESEVSEDEGLIIQQIIPAPNAANDDLPLSDAQSSRNHGSGRQRD